MNEKYFFSLFSATVFIMLALLEFVNNNVPGAGGFICFALGLMLTCTSSKTFPQWRRVVLIGLFIVGYISFLISLAT